MLQWVLIFLIVAIVAGVFDFTGIALASAQIAKVILEKLLPVLSS